ncbi:hypothetical protein CW304_21705 [Bacillus sp. UFRGS-B20]|nr:hypothetical protein CW304_21705 [Bacillus sp. UFRGS-B20]
MFQKKNKKDYCNYFSQTNSSLIEEYLIDDFWNSEIPIIGRKGFNFAKILQMNFLTYESSFIMGLVCKDFFISHDNA